MNTITMRAFTPKGTRLTVLATTTVEAKARLVQICRDLGLPIRRTMATARVIASPYYPRYRKPRTQSRESSAVRSCLGALRLSIVRKPSEH